MRNDTPDFSTDEALSASLQADLENIFEWYEQQHSIPNSRLRDVTRELLG